MLDLTFNDNLKTKDASIIITRDVQLLVNNCGYGCSIKLNTISHLEGGLIKSLPLVLFLPKFHH